MEDTDSGVAAATGVWRPFAGHLTRIGALLAFANGEGAVLQPPDFRAICVWIHSPTRSLSYPWQVRLTDRTLAG